MNKQYIINTPQISGIISDDYMYYEGINKPIDIFLIKDGDELSDNSIEILQRYFNDIYNLFLRKISIFVSSEYTDEEESLKIQALLQELIKTKKLIKNSDKDLL